jgi:hypothetical protein
VSGAACASPPVSRSANHLAIGVAGRHEPVADAVERGAFTDRVDGRIDCGAGVVDEISAALTLVDVHELVAWADACGR